MPFVRVGLSLLFATAFGVLAGSAPQRRAAYGTWGVDTSSISKTVEPGDDFFTYVNEGWIRTTEIPEGSWDHGRFSALRAATGRRVRGIVQGAVDAFGQKGPEERMVAGLYAGYVCVEAIERRGLSPIRGDLRGILGCASHEDVARWMADPRSSGIVRVNVYPEAGEWLVHLDQQNPGKPMLGLPWRELYTPRTGETDHRPAYLDYMAATLERAGADRPRERASEVLALEARLAASQWGLEKLRDRKANYHPIAAAKLGAYAPEFPWATFLRARGIGGVSRVVLGTDTAVREAARVFGETPVSVWTSYLAFHWVQNQVDFLPAAFRDASFEFYGRRLSGVKAPPSRAERGFGYVDGSLGQLVGKLYVRRYFPASARREATEIFECLRRAFARSIDGAAWMDPRTRTEAKAKLAAFRLKVGYPSAWRDYSGLSIRADDAIGNARRIGEADWADQVGRLNGRNRSELWYQKPQTVDASYSVLLNAIEVPAAMLQPPFFDPAADPAVNFGSIAAIIGHEMGHGFDDQGVLFDAKGRMRNWWTPGSRARFTGITRALVAQYGTFKPLKGLRVNGRLTLGENIGDLTGVSLAYRAYQLYLRDHGRKAAPVRDGFTGDQRFFLAWAQTWGYIAPESAIRYIVANDYHAPARFRVNGVVRNLDAWYKAFGVRPGQGLYLPPKDRVRLW